VATARLTGQATGAALVAYCFLISSSHGPMYALAVAAGFAALGALASFSRLLVRKGGAG
jgi:DHA2 family multidrug resistance protein-like MFS transporter